MLTSEANVTSYRPVPMWVTKETPLPFTNVPFPATEANKFGETAEAVGGTSAVAEFHCPTAGTLIRTSAQSSYKFTTGEGFTCDCRRIHCDHVDAGQIRRRSNRQV